jgi:hypothetical protein
MMQLWLLIIILFIIIAIFYKHTIFGGYAYNPNMTKDENIQILAKLSSIKDIETQKLINHELNNLLSDPSRINQLKYEWSKYHGFINKNNEGNRQAYDVAKYIEENMSRLISAPPDADAAAIGIKKISQTRDIIDMPGFNFRHVIMYPDMRIWYMPSVYNRTTINDILHSPNLDWSKHMSELTTKTPLNYIKANPNGVGKFRWSAVGLTRNKQVTYNIIKENLNGIIPNCPWTDSFLFRRDFSEEQKIELSALLGFN